MTKTKVLRRVPTVKVRAKVALLNKAAMALLAQDGESWMCICRVNDEVFLSPLEVPEGTLAVRPVKNPEYEHGQARLSIKGIIAPGDYELVWRGDVEAGALKALRSEPVLVGEDLK